MKNFIQHHPWKVIEETFHPLWNRVSESLFSLGNGNMGHRGNFEEGYSGETLQGHYVAGVYYPDKTRVGWWKIGYPEYFAKVLNAPAWIGIGIELDEEPVDLARMKVERFWRELDMRTGTLTRTFAATTAGGKAVEVTACRFCSMARKELGLIRYRLTSKNFNGRITLTLDADADVKNQDANYDEKFWREVSRKVTDQYIIITAATLKTDFHVSTGTAYRIFLNGKPVSLQPEIAEREKYAAHRISIAVQAGDTIEIVKYGVIASSFNHSKQNVELHCHRLLDELRGIPFEQLHNEHIQRWEEIWRDCDITIEGDAAAQQGIRFAIFHLMQTYTGEDERLNIGPKGFTGEKYGGSTYWDTEAYCLPFYMSTAGQHVARNLLLYRYRHLPKAIENARKLGFENGAALYPMVTMNGEECHNEWEITFEEIHRNGAIAYAIYDYVRYTGDEEYLTDYGLEVLLALSRFWSQRVNWSDAKGGYVMLGVTGPNEYENNVNNNWYTNYIARWTLTYTLEVLAWARKHAGDKTRALTEKAGLRADEEKCWQDIIEKLYLPEDPTRGIFLQQDGFLDKELRTVDSLKPAERPLNQHWSWDRILRSCFIKQADVLQGLYFFEDHFDREVIRKNFDFYEPMTVHESSLSPCVHAILACSLGYLHKAYEMFLRTARLDLDDYNNDTEDGLHVTSMAGTWMSLVKGFGGMRVKDGRLYLNPIVPGPWQSYSFRILFRNRVLRITAKQGTEATVKLESGNPIEIQLGDKILNVQ
ncbi:MAG: maltose phosphorylase [Cyclobacteriaceae bacterium]|nr:MAG: maltose phosphorylase [Cyclobacteriaceae bacterium]